MQTTRIGENIRIFGNWSLCRRDKLLQDK